jgi:hypothetical protein
MPRWKSFRTRASISAQQWLGRDSGSTPQIVIAHPSFHCHPKNRAIAGSRFHSGIASCSEVTVICVSRVGMAFRCVPAFLDVCRFRIQLFLAVDVTPGLRKDSPQKRDSTCVLEILQPLDLTIEPAVLLALTKLFRCRSIDVMRGSQFFTFSQSVLIPEPPCPVSRRGHPGHCETRLLSRHTGSSRTSWNLSAFQ